MENIGKLLMLIIEGMKQSIYVYGYEISMWEIFLFSIIAGIICQIIGGIINDE